jgi:hypothetical protein
MTDVGNLVGGEFFSYKSAFSALFVVIVSWGGPQEGRAAIQMLPHCWGRRGYNWGALGKAQAADLVRYGFLKSKSAL